MDQLKAFCDSFNFDSQVELNDSVKNFSDHLCSIMSPFLKWKEIYNLETARREVIWKKKINLGLKSSVSNYTKITCDVWRYLIIFKCVANHNELTVAKRKYKICEARLKRRYKRQEGNMLEGLKLMNPKLFYRKFSSKRRIKPRVSVDEFF